MRNAEPTAMSAVKIVTTTPVASAGRLTSGNWNRSVPVERSNPVGASSAKPINSTPEKRDTNANAIGIFQLRRSILEPDRPSPSEILENVISQPPSSLERRVAAGGISRAPAVARQ